ncbi:hypothetical protein GKC56_05490 [Neisseriaceae bacterium PsAf]|nr:hypothetical protein [Neisseriaceae bacterium PsAf]
MQVNDEALQEGLDRLADALSLPLLEENTSLAELKNIQAEFVAKSHYFYWKHIEVMAESIYNHSHPIVKQPNIGNLDTLKDKPNSNLMSELRKFHQQYYSANIMSAVVYSKLPKKQLITLSKKYLTQIPNKHVQLPEIKAKRITTKRNILHQQTEEDKTQAIILTFQVPKLKQNWHTFKYISELLTNRQSNSA